MLIPTTVEPVASFNSILVQLEASSDTEGAVTDFCFNSILVQLEAQKEYTERLEDAMFQFHIGAIRSLISECLKRGFISFNSILVQLEVLRGNRQKVRSFRFNSILVQLEDISFSRVS